MHYQPKMDKKSRIIGIEALVRWRHPKFGNLPPCIFVSIAETSDQINILGRWINERCMQDIQRFRETGMPDMQVAINASPKQFIDNNFFNDFLTIIDKYQIPHSIIELEITESQKLHLTDETLEGIKQLSQQGISIAVDDFGMGYTSLRYLKSFKVDTVKLDGNIVCDVTNSNAVQEIIRSLASLTQSMNSKLVAEWVEDEEQFNKLLELGCNQFQGAYFSMPVSREVLIEQYANHTSQSNE
jgi:EAL domain-containing protein (putative c-di-GMP-specific phosphodiesterase class I)